MPTDIRLIHAHDFIRATPQGKLDLAKSKELLLEIAAAAKPSGPHDIIIDLRRAQSVLSTTDLWYLAQELSRMPAIANRKQAVIVIPERFDRAEFYELCARNRGIRVRAFISFDEAFEWLMADADPPA